MRSVDAPPPGGGVTRHRRSVGGAAAAAIGSTVTPATGASATSVASDRALPAMISIGGAPAAVTRSSVTSGACSHRWRVAGVSSWTVASPPRTCTEIPAASAWPIRASRRARPSATSTQPAAAASSAGHDAISAGGSQAAHSATLP